MLPDKELLEQLERVQYWIANWDEESPYRPERVWVVAWGEKNLAPHEIIDMAIKRIEEDSTRRNPLRLGRG